MNKKVQNYQLLSEIDHVIKRLPMYAGNRDISDHNDYVVNDSKISPYILKYTPALVKVISEIIDNSIDEANRGNVNIIKFNYDRLTRRIVIEDNGGIPIKKHQDIDMYIPSMIFGMLRSSSNYDDEEQTSLIGTNGLGAKLTNITSKYFEVETSDGELILNQIWTNNMKDTSGPEIIESESGKSYTQISFDVDFDLFKTSIYDEDWIQYIKFYLYTLSINNPKCKIFFNNQRIEVNSVDAFLKINELNGFNFKNTWWDIGIFKSDDSKIIDNLSFVNGVFTRDGGTHVQMIINNVMNDVAKFINKKFKLNIKPAVLKNYFNFIICAKIIKPEFDSQTKTRLVTPADKFEHTFASIKKQINDKLLDESYLADVIENILAATNERTEKEISKLSKTNKSVLRSLTKFFDCSSKDYNDRTLYLTEGDSAKTIIMAVRDPKIHAVFPLRGKPINGYVLQYKELLENEEFNNIIKIITYNESMNFSRIVIASDSDEFGYGICGLICATICKHLPEFADKIYRLNTPQIVVTQGKETIEFFAHREYEAWKSQNTKKFSHKYYKGLGTWKPTEFKRFMNDKYLLKFVQSDKDNDMFELCFSKNTDSADNRKVWLSIGEQN